jgi:hypothetical protein
MEDTMMEEIDIAFHDWWNTAQPLSQVVKECFEGPMHPNLARSIKAQIRVAFVQGYARGVAGTVANSIVLPDPDR